MTQPSTGSDEVWSIRRILTWAADDLRRRGNESGRLDAELLLARAIGLDRVGLVMHAERALTPAELSAFREVFKRRRAGEPVAYLLGEREFYGISFQVDARVLVPRPETETLVDVALARTRSRSMFGNALDLCTGSGCVAIAFARARGTWRVTATDVSEDALSVARRNAARTGAVRNLRLMASDLFGALHGERFDLITANPPYIPSGELDQLPLDVRAFEPRLALDGGEDGLDLVRRIASQALAHLSPRGLLALEIGAEQGAEAHAILRNAGYSALEIARDLAGRDRVISGYGPA